MTTGLFDTTTTHGLARAMRLAMIQNVYGQGALPAEDAKELLRGCLTPGDESTRYDDSDKLNLELFDSDEEDNNNDDEHPDAGHFGNDDD